MLEALVAAGANLEARSHGMSVLDHAALDGQLDLIPWLIEKGARPGQDDKALSFLVASGYPRAFEMFQLLTDAGAQVTDELLMDAATPR